MGRRVVVITGASTGLGLAIARELLAGDDHLILTARASSLGRFAAEGIHESERVWLRPLDVTDATQREAVVREAAQELDGVDVLVNNAGVSYRSVIEHISTDEHHRQLDINYLGPMALAALVLPCMRRKRAGRIIQISSASGFMAMPTMGLYTASKFALEGATEALYYEVRPFGIKVSLVLPGFINSDGFEKVVWTERGCEAGNDHHDPYHPHYRHMSDFVGTIMKRAISTPESVAHTVVRTMNARWPKLRVPGTLDMRVLYSLRKLLPQRVYHELLYRMLPGLRHWGTNAVPIEASRPLLTAPSVVLPRETSTPTRTLPE